MPNHEKQQLEKALGLQLESVQLDWLQFKKDYGIQHDNPEDDTADRAFFTWQHFRGEHRPQSCLLDDDGRVRGLIIKESELKQLQLPALPALEYCCVVENKQLTDIQLLGTEYPLLQYADWSNNALKRVNLQVELPLLRYWSLRNNKLNRFKITQSNGLPALEELDLSHNRIKNWDALVVDKMLALEYLWLSENPLNESVTTYREEGEDSNYLHSLRTLRKSFGTEKPVKNDTYKVLVVGDGKAGKSCMVKRLVENEFCGGWDSTHGIAVEQFEDTDNRYGFSYRLNLWDFGGQEIYHHTHRMFLQANATYILLWNEETEYQDTIEQTVGPKKYYWENKKVPYWLDYIRYLGQNSPVVVAQTCSPREDRKKPHPDEAELIQAYREALPYVSEFLHIDAEEDDPKASGYKRFLQELEYAIDSLERKEYLPAHWLPVREKLEEMTPREAAKDRADFMSIQRNTLELEEFLDMVPDQEPEPMKLLTNWLVPTGVVFYKKGLFDDKIILNQAWAIRAVYALYDRSETGYYFELKERKGRFDGSLLNQCWHAYTEAEREWFLGFMLKAELCFETTEERRDTPWEKRQFVAVEMLPADRPPGLAIQERNWESQGIALCQLRYRYPFLHAGIIQSFIARTHHFAAIEDIYKQGMVVIVAGHPVLIEARPDPQGSRGDILITLPTAGVEVLHRIRKEFEDIHGGREHEEAVRPADSEWVNWAVLEEKRQDTHLPTADGGSAVPAEPYRVFLPDEKQRELQALSETRSLALKGDVKQYPKLPENIISVSMEKDISNGKGWSVTSEKSINVLFTAATPIDAGQLNTGLESRLKDVIKEFDEKKRIKFEEEHGLRVQKFRRFLFTKDPHVIHFAGHGEREGLVLQDDNLDAEVLISLVAELDNTRIVVLNACYTLPLAKELAQYVPFVIGTQGPIPDSTATVFAHDFYVGLSAGKSVEKSFKFALNGIKSERLPGADIPILVIGEPYFNH